MDNPSLPWKIVVGGPLPGAAERFRYTEEGYLYSHLMGEEVVHMYFLNLILSSILSNLILIFSIIWHLIIDLNTTITVIFISCNF